MKGKTLFLKYFKVFSIMIIASFVFLGIVFISVASSSFQEDNYLTLRNRLLEVHAFTLKRMRYNNVDKTIYYSYELNDHYRLTASLTDSLIFFCDINGNVLISSETNRDGTIAPADVPSTVMSRLLGDRSLNETSTLGGRLSAASYIVAQLVHDVKGNVIGSIFVASSAREMYAFVQNMIQMFTVSVLVVLVFVFIIVYISTKRQILPLQVMVEATRRFSRGDFSMRVPVNGDDEVSQLAESLNSMAKAIADMESNRRSFTANVSHELKTPMTSIGGFIDGILDGTIPPEKQNYYLQIVSMETKRLSRLVNSMLNISKIEAGEQKLRISRVDINSIVISTTLMFEKKLEEKRIEVRGLDSERLFVECDEDLIHQVIYNLVDNAVKFVNVDGYLEFGFTPVLGKVFISLKNSGDGLKDDEISRVFDRFYKTDRSRGLDKNGVGLGLHIVRTILNLHSGDVQVKSVVGEYTEFTFSLPSSENTRRRRHPKNTDADTKIELPYIEQEDLLTPPT